MGWQIENVPFEFVMNSTMSQRSYGSFCHAFTQLSFTEQKLGIAFAVNDGCKPAFCPDLSTVWDLSTDFVLDFKYCP